MFFFVILAKSHSFLLYCLKNTCGKALVTRHRKYFCIKSIKHKNCFEKIGFSLPSLYLQSYIAKLPALTQNQAMFWGFPVFCMFHPPFPGISYVFLRGDGLYQGPPAITDLGRHPKEAILLDHGYQNRKPLGLLVKL